MKKYLFLFLFTAGFTLAAGEFDLFDEGTQMNPSVFNDFKFNKIRTSYSFFPSEQRKFGLSFSRYFTRKFGFIIELDQSEYGSSMKEKSELIIAGTYRFTKRAWTWVFLGDIGLSINDDVEDFSGVSKGFRTNHLYGRFSVEYIFGNGLGFDYSMVGRMTLETGVEEDIFPIHSIGLIYQF